MGGGQENGGMETVRIQRESNKPIFKIDWTINPTHILAFLGALLTAAIFVYSLRDDVIKTNNSLEKMFIELKNKNELQDAEIKQLRENSTASRTEEAQFRGEMRQAVAALDKILTQLRIDQSEFNAMIKAQQGIRNNR